MMYNEITIEKGLYNLSGKSFCEALEAMDPSSNYENSEMKGLDAFERQLKRFDIKVCGSNSDMVEKFFSSTESAVLFPEYVRRCVAQGFNSCKALNELVAAQTQTNATDYRSISVVPEANKPYTTAISEGTAIPETTISLDGELVSLVKYGRVISTTYEAIRQQRLSLFSVTLKSIGVQLAGAVFAQAIGTLINGNSVGDAATVKTMVGETFNYNELVTFWGEFKDYNLTTLVVSPSTMAKILAFDEMKNCQGQYMTDGTLKTPFGATLIKSSAVENDEIVGLDNSCALEMILCPGIILENDKLINRQIDRTAITVTTGFSKIIGDATLVLSLA